MTSINSANTTSPVNTPDSTTAATVSNEETTGADAVSVVYSDQEGTSNTDDSGSGAGDGADSNGLTFPSFSSDMKETMLILASLQSESTESQVEFSSDQIEALVSEKFDLAADNVSKASKARSKGEKAKFWSNVAKDIGYAGSALVILASVATLNPVLFVAGTAMIAATAMNETGATQDVINAAGGGDSVVGTIIVGAGILVLSAATGGVAGLTLLTTLAPAMLVTPENLDNMGVSSEAAVWISVAVGVTVALVGSVAIARMTTSVASVGQKSVTLADDAASVTDDAASVTDDAASVSDDVAASSDDAAGLSNDAAGGADNAVQAADQASSASYQSARKTANAIMDAAEVSAENVDDAAGIASKAKQIARSVASGRLERVLQNSVSKFVNTADDASKAVALTKNMVAMNRATAGVEALLDGVMTVAQIMNADYSKDAATLEADAGLSEAQSEYASAQETIFENRISSQADSFSTQLSRTEDALRTFHAATSQLLA